MGLRALRRRTGCTLGAVSSSLGEMSHARVTCTGRASPWGNCRENWKNLGKLPGKLEKSEETARKIRNFWGNCPENEKNLGKLPGK